MVNSKHKCPYGLYRNKAGEPVQYRFRHRHLEIKTVAKEPLLFPAWVIGHNAMSTKVCTHKGLITHLFVPRFVVHWEHSTHSIPSQDEYEMLSVMMSQPIPLDEISQETLNEPERLNCWMEEAAAAVLCHRGLIKELLPENGVDDEYFDDGGKMIQQISE